MATFPLATLACTIDANGISAPSYTDILGSLTASLQSIYGSDIYIDPDSQDGQWIAVLAQMVNDGNQADITTYNSYSPTYAQGAGLSSVVKINGLRRQTWSNSTAVVTLVGQAGSTISNGVAQDTSQNLWNLPTTVTIPLSGSIDVTAVAQQPGNIIAPAGTITTIYTPTRGWQSVTNAVAATPGNPVEMDATLRQRQAASTSISAITPLQAIISNVAETAGIGRYAIYQNKTGATDSNGIPGHSIAVVAEGGDVAAIANAIEAKVSPGTGTYGTTTETVEDPAGVPTPISFFEMSEVYVIVQANIVPLTGYVSTTGTLAQNAIVQYFANFPIGQDSMLGKLFGPANLSGDAATSSSGQTQQQLDVLSNTYNLPIQNLFQGRSDMVTTASAAAGATTIIVENVASMANGQLMLVDQADGSQLAATIAGISGGTVTFTPAIASGKSISSGAQVLINADLEFSFNEGANCQTSDVLINP